jgi:hypothetical protein
MNTDEQIMKRDEVRRLYRVEDELEQLHAELALNSRYLYGIAGNAVPLSCIFKTADGLTAFSRENTGLAEVFHRPLNSPISKEITPITYPESPSPRSIRKYRLIRIIQSFGRHGESVPEYEEIAD